MNSMIELHDTRVEAITRVGTQTVLCLRVYIHRSTGKPGIDAGTGWLQAAALVFSGATLEGETPEFPADIMHSVLLLNGVELANQIPLPFDSVGKIALALTLYNEAENAEIVIRGSRLTLTLLGEAVYVENFSP